MSDINTVVLVGNLTRDPELAYTGEGKALCKFGIANHYVFTKNGERQEKVSFFEIAFWGHMAEVSAEFLKKGRKVALMGTLDQSRWEDKESGQKRSAVKVIARSIQFLGGQKDAAETPAPVGAEEASSQEESEESDGEAA